MKTRVLIHLLASVSILTAACTKNDSKAITQASETLSVSPLTTLAVTPTPNQVLDLSLWKLSVPVDANGGNTGAATTISNNSLLHGYSSSYFYVLDSPYTNVVRFWCPVNGATTTPGSGSDHPRTELQETPLTWYTQDQPGITGETIGGRLSAVVSVKQFPDTADVIIGQIHGAGTVASGYPFVMLHIRNDSVIAYVKGDTVGNAGTVHATLLTNVALGAQVTYSIVDSSNNKIYITASAPGASGTGSWNTPVPTPWQTVQVRFTAGNYLQDHEPGAASSIGCKLNCYSLKITH